MLAKTLVRPSQLMLSNMGAVGSRVIRQLRRDPRFVAIALVMPVLIMYMLFLFFDGVDAPIFDPKKFVVPIGAFMVHFITYALCAIVLVRERTTQTLSRMFISGYRQIEIVGGYLIAYSILATLQSLIVLVGLNLLFKLDYGLGTFVIIYGVIWMLAMLSIALGMFVSNFARNEGQVMPMIPLVIMISVFFSGMLLPIEKLPEFIRGVRYLTPMFYANEGIQALIAKGAQVGDAVGSLLGLGLYGVILLTLAAGTLRERD
ncbi:MAG: ABC transporter permease [Anaerolinea sp.]|nr:ABC transporter permease [Anaerolinea sp.]MCC6972507.1 ABC transporter permease [Anaerolineae bacterium]